MKTRNLLVISCALHLLATCITMGQGPTGAIIQLDETELQQWRLPAKVEMTVTGGASTEFAGSNNKLETGAPLFSEAPRKAGATFYRCDKVTGFPYRVNSIDPAPNRPGSSSFIAIKTEANGYRKTWICASMGAYKINGTTGNIMNWEYQVRYFSGDTNLNLPETITIGTVPNVPNYVGGAVTKYSVMLQEAPRPTLSLHRLSPSASDAKETDLVSTSIRPFPSPRALGGEEPLGLGVVADGVTPVLVKATLMSAWNEEARFKIILSTSDSDQSAQFLAGKIHSFRHTGSVLGEFVSTNELVFPALTTNTFAYIEGFPAHALGGLSQSTSLTATLKLEGVASPQSEVSFQIVKPPIVLVHGYRSDSSTWTPAFLEVLRQKRLQGFVKPIQYGVSGGGDKIVNTTWPLRNLAPLLDSELIAVEEDLRRNWSFTRYDVVAHSQGGVLARMLCSRNGTYAGSKPYANYYNHYRGRFNRVITIGSPHNGSRLAYYGQLIGQRLETDLFWNSICLRSVVPGVLAYLIGSNLEVLLPPKFLPFDITGTGSYPEIVEVNMDPVDHRALLCLVQGSYEESDPSFRLFSGLLNLSKRVAESGTIGDVVIPHGSDGVVDADSQVALRSGSTNKHHRLNGSIVHFHSPLYGNTDAETWSPNVSTTVLGLLDGDGSDFGPFYPPAPLSNTIRRSIIDAASAWQLIPVCLSLSRSSRSTLSEARSSQAPTSEFEINATLDSVELSGEVPTWKVVVFGPSGETTNGVVIAASPTGRSAVVQVEDGVVGDVFAYMTATTQNGGAVIAGPMLVTSRSPTGKLTRVSLLPASAVVPTGTSTSLEIWGEYSGGEKMRLFLNNSEEQKLVSGDSRVAVLTPSGRIAAIGPGSTTVTLNYQGLLAEAQVTVFATSSSTSLKLAYERPSEHRLTLRIMSTPNQSVTIEQSSTLDLWKPVTNFVSTAQETSFEVQPAQNGQASFYRASMSPLPSAD